MLTIVSLMRRLNPEMYETQIVDYINKLNAVDPMRSSYYEDLSKLYNNEYDILMLGQWRAS